MRETVQTALRLAAAALVLALAACAPITLIGPEEVRVRNALVVKSPIAWARIEVDDNDIWTVDGTLLQELRFAVAVEDGEPVLAFGEKEKRPTFRSTMTPLEIAELVGASFTAAGLVEPKTTNIRPVRFGGVSGFRFDLSLLGDDGLEWQGFAVGAVKDKKLYLIVYSGAALHYFAKNREDAERVIASARIL